MIGRTAAVIAAGCVLFTLGAPVGKLDDGLVHAFETDIGELLQVGEGRLEPIPNTGEETLLQLDAGYGGGSADTNAWMVDLDGDVAEQRSDRQNFLDSLNRAHKKHVEKVTRVEAEDAAKAAEEEAKRWKGYPKTVTVKTDSPVAGAVPGSASGTASAVGTAAETIAAAMEPVYIPKAERDDPSDKEASATKKVELLAAPVENKEQLSSQSPHAGLSPVLPSAGGVVAPVGATLKEQEKYIKQDTPVPPLGLIPEERTSQPPSDVTKANLAQSAQQEPGSSEVTNSMANTKEEPVEHREIRAKVSAEYPSSIWGTGELPFASHSRTGHCSLYGDAVAYEFDRGLTDLQRFTVEFHIKVQSWSDNVMLFNQIGDVAIMTSSNSSTEAIFQNPVVTAKSSCAGRALRARMEVGQYHHVTVTTSRGVVSLYVDGELADSEPVTAGCKVSRTKAKPLVGGNTDMVTGGHMTNQFSASMDTIRLWNRGMDRDSVARSNAMATRDIANVDFASLQAAAFPHPTIPNFPSQFSFAEVESRITIPSA